MKQTQNILWICVIILGSVLIRESLYKTLNPIDNTHIEIKQKTDKLNNNNYLYIIDDLQCRNELLKDSINSIETKLFITNYKLERIRYYNNIAKRGNNIKYLRGWINRTLINRQK